MNKLLAAVAAVMTLVAVAAVAYAVGGRTPEPSAARAAAPADEPAADGPANEEPADEEPAEPAEDAKPVAAKNKDHKPLPTSCVELARYVEDDLGLLARNFGTGNASFMGAYDRLAEANWSLCEDARYPSPVDDAILAAQQAAGLEGDDFRQFDNEMFGLMYGYMPEGDGEPLVFASAKWPNGEYGRSECIRAGSVVGKLRISVDTTNDGDIRSGFMVRVDAGTGENTYQAYTWIEVPPIDPGVTARSNGIIDFGEPYIWNNGAWCEITDISPN